MSDASLRRLFLYEAVSPLPTKLDPRDFVVKMSPDRSRPCLSVPSAGSAPSESHPTHPPSTDDTRLTKLEEYKQAFGHININPDADRNKRRKKSAAWKTLLSDEPQRRKGTTLLDDSGERVSSKDHRAASNRTQEIVQDLLDLDKTYSKNSEDARTLAKKALGQAEPRLIGREDHKLLDIWLGTTFDALRHKKACGPLLGSEPVVL